MRKYCVGGNWKLKVPKTADSIVLAKDLVEAVSSLALDNVEVFIAPSFTALAEVGIVIKDSPVKLGAQNMSTDEKGSLTGETSVLALKELGVDYVLIGHSERRHQVASETDEEINKKVKLALKHGLTAVLCIGEKGPDRAAGKTEEVNERQLSLGLKDVAEADLDKVVIAYEPVWAINNPKLNPGVEIKAATPKEAEDAHQFIRNWFATNYSESAAKNIQIQYGGSMDDKNCSNFLPLEDVDGGLIGTAACVGSDNNLSIERFVVIIKECMNA